MNFEEIEGLTQEQINELYNDTVQLATKVWYFRCDETGKTGHYLSIYDCGDVGYRNYSVRGEDCSRTPHGIFCNSCGNNKGGYVEHVSCVRKSWDFYCSDGRQGRYLSNGCGDIGFYSYGAEDCSRNPAGIICNSCGSGRYGYVVHSSCYYYE